MRIAIFGATSRIGRHAVVRAAELGHDVLALSSSPAPSSQGGVAWIEGDVRDLDAVRRFVAVVDAIVAALGPRAYTEAEARALEDRMRNIVASAIVRRMARFDVEPRPMDRILASWGEAQLRFGSDRVPRHGPSVIVNA